MAERFRKKVRAVEAMQWTGDNFMELRAWAGAYVARGSGSIPGTVRVVTPTGDTFAELGDWIVMGAPDDFYPVKADAFAELFERDV